MKYEVDERELLADIKKWKDIYEEAKYEMEWALRIIEDKEIELAELLNKNKSK